MNKERHNGSQELSYFDRVNFCNQILRADSKIRSVGWVHTHGTVHTLVHREGHEPLLSKGEATSALIQATMRLLSRQIHDKKLGKTIYSITVHEKLARISMPLGDDSALLLSVERDVDYGKLVFNKIMPILEKNNFSNEL